MSRIIEKYWPDSVVEHGGVTRTVTAWAADIGYTPAGLARILSRSDDFSKVLIPELERRYNEPYEVAKRARKDVAKRARVAAVALSSEQRAATRRAGAIERARAADERRINSALRTRRQTVGRQILKRVLVHYSGGCCEKCGYREFQSVLEFHHRDPSEKSGQISKMVSALSTCADFGLRFREVMTECDKCLLLCPTCHRVEHHYERMKPGSLVLSMLPTQDQLSHLGLRRSDFKTLG